MAKGSSIGNVSSVNTRSQDLNRAKGGPVSGYQPSQSGGSQGMPAPEFGASKPQPTYPGVGGKK